MSRHSTCSGCVVEITMLRAEMGLTLVPEAVGQTSSNYFISISFFKVRFTYATTFKYLIVSQIGNCRWTRKVVYMPILRVQLFG